MRSFEYILDLDARMIDTTAGRIIGSNTATGRSWVHIAFATTKIATYNVASQLHSFTAQHSPVKIGKATLNVSWLLETRKKVAGFFFVPGAFPRAAAPRLLVSWRQNQELGSSIASDRVTIVYSRSTLCDSHLSAHLARHTRDRIAAQSQACQNSRRHL
jgi:hypothetical protein